jgi:hypothetical protein
MPVMGISDFGLRLPAGRQGIRIAEFGIGVFRDSDFEN